MPPEQRQTTGQAIAFAKVLAAGIKFETCGNPANIIRAWLVQEVLSTDRGRELPSPAQAPMASVAASLAALRAGIAAAHRHSPPRLSIVTTSLRT